MADSNTTTNNKNNKNSSSNNKKCVQEKEYDILIIGAGISGISAAYHVQTHFPNKSYRILEGRKNLGGTWEFFKYPGIRCDSYMYTFCFSFRPWQSKKIIVGADVILDYLKDTVKEYDLERHIEYQTQVQSANWDSQQAKWILQATTTRARKGTTTDDDVDDDDDDDDEDSGSITYKAPYIFLCTGYYDYEKGYQPTFPNQEAFQGPIIHPQHWPTDLDYTNKKIVVVGSGATAITLIPALIKTGAQHVTMLQRSPTYIVAAPSTSRKLAQTIAKYFGHAVTRWYFIAINMLFYWFCRTFPQKARKGLLMQARQLIGEERFDPQQFTPRYDPWDERLCLSPDGDFYTTIKTGKADIVTDHIQEFTPTGIRLRDNTKEELQADIIITATGLQLLYGGGMKVAVDGTPVVPSTKFSYKGFMLDGLPNLFFAGGYTNASWTLKCDLTNNAACKLIKAIERRGGKYCQPEIPTYHDNGGEGKKMPTLPFLDLQSGYVQRFAANLPKQSDHLPWKLHQNYIKDKILLQYMPIEDEAMKFY